jgi:hypothetical protein
MQPTANIVNTVQARGLAGMHQQGNRTFQASQKCPNASLKLLSPKYSFVHARKAQRHHTANKKAEAILRAAPDGLYSRLQQKILR